MGPLLLYWLGISWWCFSHCVLAPQLLYFCFFFIPTSFLPLHVSFVFILLRVLSAHVYPLQRKHCGQLLGLLCLLLSLSGLVGSLGKTSYHTSLWGFYPFLSSFLPRAFMTHQLSLYFSFTSYCTCGPADPLNFTSFFGLSQPVYLAFTFYCICRLAGPLDFIFNFLFSLGFYDPFALLLPFIMLVSLLVVISCHTGLLSFIFFFLSSLGFYDPFASILLFYSFLLYFCLLLGLYAVESPLSFFFFFK